MKFQQIRSATSIVTFANRRFLIDPMLSAQGTYPAVPDTTSTGRGNPDCDLPCPIQDLFNVDAVIVTHLHFDHFDKAAAELLPKKLPLFSQSVQEAKILSGLGFTDVRVLADSGTDFNGIRLFRTDCDHGSSNLVTMDGYRDCGFSEKSFRRRFLKATLKNAFLSRRRHHLLPIRCRRNRKIHARSRRG